MEQGEREKMSEKQFRFQDFEIWKKGVSLSGPLEVANILILLRQDGKINSTDVESLLQELEQESRIILAFRNSLKC